MDHPPENTPRVLQDAYLEVREGQRIPVLAQPQGHRMLVLNSPALNHMYVGQTVVLRLPEAEPTLITIESIDHLALIVRYVEGAIDL
jgi:hypothetical protein